MAANIKIRVAVRICPVENTTETDIKINENQVIVKDCYKFIFSQVLSSKTTKDEVYNRSVKPLIGNVLKGYNVAILAYGQIGSGKTHTMDTCYKGELEKGVIPRSIIDIFELARDHFSYDCKITVSFFEMYNECVYDLLSGKAKEECVLDNDLKDTRNGAYLSEPTEVHGKSAREVLDLLIKASSKRATRVTATNNSSSMSHAVVSLNLSMTHKSDKQESKRAKLQLIDLAGHDKKENIKNGHLEFENVINCLVDRKSSDIPYEDSTITTLLKDALGGNCITLLLAFVNPSENNTEESLATLKLADKVQDIRNNPTINQVSSCTSTEEMKSNITLRAQKSNKISSRSDLEELEYLRNKISNLENERKTIQEKISKYFNKKNDENDDLTNESNDCDILTQIEDMLQMINTYKKETKSSKQRIKYLEGDVLKSLKEEKKNLQMEKKELQMEIKELKGEIMGFKERNRELEPELKKRKGEIKGIKERNRELETGPKERKGEIKGIKERNRELETGPKERKGEIKGIKERNRELETGPKERKRQPKENVRPSDTIKENDDIRKSPIPKKKQKTTKAEKGASSKEQTSGGCTCKTDCSRKNCRCNKTGKGCTPSCKCMADVCRNRTN